MSAILTISQFLPVKQAPRGVRVRSHIITGAALNTLSVNRRRRPALGKYNWLKIMSYALIAGNVALLGMRVVEANSYAVKGYEITQLRNNIAELQNENKKLSVRLSENTSIVGAQQIVAERQFVPIVATEFLRSRSPQVSQR